MAISETKCWCCPVSERLAKQLSKKISASFELTGKPQWENFCLANRSLTGHGRYVVVTPKLVDIHAAQVYNTSTCGDAPWRALSCVALRRRIVSEVSLASYEASGIKSARPFEPHSLTVAFTDDLLQLYPAGSDEVEAFFRDRAISQDTCRDTRAANTLRIRLRRD